MAFIRFLDISLWCAHVTVNPDANKNAVLSNGILIGLIGLIGLKQHVARNKQHCVALV